MSVDGRTFVRIFENKKGEMQYSIMIPQELMRADFLFKVLGAMYTAMQLLVKGTGIKPLSDKDSKGTQDLF